MTGGQKKRQEKIAEKQNKSMPREDSETLKGWTAIGAFLGLAPATAQRWARDGMPVKREGRFTTANRKELQEWLGRESHMPAPAQVVTEGTDLADPLKKSLKTSKTAKAS